MTEFNLSKKIVRFKEDSINIILQDFDCLYKEEVKQFIKFSNNNERLNKINPLILVEEYRATLGEDNKFFFSDFIMFIRDFYLNEKNKDINKLAGDDLVE